MVSNTGSSKHVCASIYFQFSILLGLCPRWHSYLSTDFSQIWHVDLFYEQQEKNYFSGPTGSDLRTWLRLAIGDKFVTGCSFLQLLPMCRRCLYV